MSNALAMNVRIQREMLERMTLFGIQVCSLADDLPSLPSCWVLGKQIARSSTSIGANYQEAQRARSKKEFVSKLQIALQEAEETRYWLRSIEGGGHVGGQRVAPLISESSELIAILVASINTARRSGI